MASRFWHLDSLPSDRKRAEWTHDGANRLDPIECPVNPDHNGGGRRLTDLSVEFSPSAVDDVMWTWYSECMIQDPVLKLFEEQGFTGYDVRPVKARFRKASDGIPPKLWELCVTGWGGMAPEESGVRLIEERTCRACGHFVYTAPSQPGKLVDPARWDGNDFFIVWPLPRYIFVTDRVARFIRDAKLTGTRLMVPEGLQIGLSNGRLSPGRLSYWMPEPRARAIGEPLGIY